MDFNIRITGEAGHGIAAAATMLGKTVTRSGLFAFSYNDAESRVRGGLNFNHTRISNELRRGATSRLDVLVALSEAGLETYRSLLDDDGLIFSAQEWGADKDRIAAGNLEALAKEAGSAKVVGTIAVAAVCGILGLRREILKEVIEELFAEKPKVVDANLAGVDVGFSIGEKLAREEIWPTSSETPASSSASGKQGGAEKRMWLGGEQVVAGGALAGGISFMAAYPMSPSTGIITSLALWAEETDVIVVQAEDEVAAINMVAGAAYTGARAMTATSGGGFALMEEGVSLLGMIECPAVIVVAQRPGPATGLPTRQAQGDLQMVLHAGHGHFPRIVAAPRDFEDGFSIMSKAFDLAERYQVPAFVLTDQHFQDGQSTTEPFSCESLPTARHLLSREDLQKIERYRRYEPTDSGLSPMAPPGLSRHVVVVDSDEHDADGHLTESAETARQMVEKRLRKESSLRDAMSSSEFLPLVEGQVPGKPLVFSWGSTYPTVKEALDLLRSRTKLSLAHAHLSWLWPAPRARLQELVDQASRVVVVENNVDGQLLQYLRLVTGHQAEALVHRLDGRPFLVEELLAQIEREVGR